MGVSVTPGASDGPVTFRTSPVITMIIHTIITIISITTMTIIIIITIVILGLCTCGW